MSASNEWTEYHLTPRGWEMGDEKNDFAAIIERPVPHDRVQTVQLYEHQSSTFSRMERGTRILWSSPDTAAIAVLRKKFGDSPDHL